MDLEFDKVYVCPTYQCNLKCPHCNIREQEDTYDEEKLLKVVNELNSKDIILFGGEPTLYTDRLKKLLDTNKITSISTNLFNMNNEVYDLLLTHDINIATSWNPKRFTERQYYKWLNNIDKLSKHKDIIVLITMTNDLFKLNYEYVLERLWEMELVKVSGVLFETYVGDEFNREDTDNWFLNLLQLWDFKKLKNLTINKLLNWNCDCNKVITVNPDGSIYKGCPHKIHKNIILNECLECSYANICRPCPLYSTCSFLKESYNYVRNNYAK